MAGAAPILESWLGLPAPVLRFAGIALLPFAAVVGWLALQTSPARAGVQAIIAANFAWVAASILLLAGRRRESDGARHRLRDFPGRRRRGSRRTAVHGPAPHEHRVMPATMVTRGPSGRTARSAPPRLARRARHEPDGRGAARRVLDPPRQLHRNRPHPAEPARAAGDRRDARRPAARTQPPSRGRGLRRPSTGRRRSRPPR